MPREREKAKDRASTIMGSVRKRRRERRRGTEGDRERKEADNEKEKERRRAIVCETKTGSGRYICNESFIDVVVVSAAG